MSLNNYIKPDWPAPKNIIAVTTTRACGNLILEHNRKKLIHDLNLPNEPVWLHQVHGTTVISVDSPTPALTADAAISTKPNRICAVLTADCLPLLITNTQGSIVAAIHAGWRGLLAGVIDNTVNTLTAHTPADTLLVWLGPAIGPKHFEVGPEVREAYLDRDKRYQTAFSAHAAQELRPDHQERGNNKFLANLYQLATLALNHLGISNNHIYGGNFCTHQDADPENHRFYSYRRDQGVTGRMATLIYFR